MLNVVIDLLVSSNNLTDNGQNLDRSQIGNCNLTILQIYGHIALGL